MAGANHDVIDMVLEQHRQVRSLFDTVEAATGEERAEQFQVLLRLLAVHEVAEEEVVHPMVRRRVPGGDELTKARLHEESAAKTALSELEDLGVEDPGFDLRFGAFRDQVLAHADKEEETTLPGLREHASSDDLRLMRAAFVAAEALAPTHPHPHGPEGAIGNMVVGPAVALMDRVRDAIRDASG